MRSQPYWIPAALTLLALFGSLRASQGLGDESGRLRIEEIRIRDPFILTDTDAAKYYMYANKGNRRDVRGWECYVTDGPWLHRLPSGRLIMLWSSFGEGDYTLGIARSESDTLRGPWRHDPQPLADDGGHCMMFRTLEGRLLLVLHSPNHGPRERARFFDVRETESTIELTPLAPDLQPAAD